MDIGYKTVSEILSDIGEALTLADAITYGRELPELNGLSDRLFEDIQLLRDYFKVED